MKKKFALRIIICIFIILITLFGGLLISEKSGFIRNIRNIKSKKIEEKQITKIDVTDLEDNSSIGHEHLFKTMYDENKHWEECTVCKQKNNEEVHTYKTTWSIGKESCIYNNSYTNACTCGYSYTGHKPCVWNGTYSTYTAGSHYIKCSICKNQIEWCYYKGTYGKGEIYYDAHSYLGNCISSNGTKLVCGNTGRCVTCGYNHRGSGCYHVWCEGENGELICELCNVVYGYVSNKTVSINNDIPYTNTYSFDITAYQKSIVRSNPNDMMWIYYNNVLDLFSQATQTITYLDSTELKYRVTTVVKAKNTNTSTTEVPIKWQCNYGINGYGQVNFNYLADDIAPTVEVESGLTEWSRTKPILIYGTENYCGNVDVKILDIEENIIFEGTANVYNEKYLISCTPELEIDTNGKKFIVIVTDTYGNSTEKEFKIAKVDAIAPKMTSSDDITGEWSKSRKFKFTATDYGIGDVSIAFNDEADLNLANYDGIEYSRNYEFYGDVYTPKQLSVLYKDGLGNPSIQKVTIDKLDNTAPTIESASIHNNVVTVNAHDRHERLGEGSGIVKYRYIASSEKLSNPDVSSGIEVNASDKMVIDNVYQVKYIYILAEDFVGNVSEVYELKVPELILTSRVDLSLANGKGGVILDWSTYDITDKYFVVYRKEENSEEWETIVSVNEKLMGSTYTDVLGNDKIKPDVPNINITRDVLNNNIKVDVTSADNGTKYNYYVEAYDINNIAYLLGISNIN